MRGINTLKMLVLLDDPGSMFKITVSFEFEFFKFKWHSNFMTIMAIWLTLSQTIDDKWSIQVNMSAYKRMKYIYYNWNKCGNYVQ